MHSLFLIALLLPKVVLIVGGMLRSNPIRKNPNLFQYVYEPVLETYLNPLGVPATTKRWFPVIRVI